MDILYIKQIKDNVMNHLNKFFAGFLLTTCAVTPVFAENATASNANAPSVAVSSVAAPNDRVAQCIKDNKNERQSEQTVADYCNCMNYLMPTDANQTVSQWEKKHKHANEACSEKAHWQ